MAPVDRKAETVYQQFRYRTSEKLQKLRADFVDDFGGRYVWWTDVQEKLGKPLRIAHTNRTYAVVLQSDLKGDDDQGDLFEIRNAYREYRDLHNTLDWCSKSKDRDYFLRVLANIEYLHRVLAQELDTYIGSSDPQELLQVRNDLRRYKQHKEQVEITSECYSLLRNPTKLLELSAPRLFVVLPNLTTWEDSDAATHKFRLYFLCEFKFDKMSTNSSPDETQSIHLSRHEGYNIDPEQATEFNQQYGRYALAVLWMVKDGFSDYQYNIPKLETMPGLNNIRSATGQSFSEASIGAYVDKAITYFENYSTRQRLLAPWLNARDTQRLGSFLQHQNDSDNKVGGLHLSIQNSSARWLCKLHSYNPLDIPEGYNIALDGWEIDRFQNKICKTLATFDEAKSFLGDITYVKQLLEVSVTLGWQAPPAFLYDHWREINRSSVKVLHVDGIVYDFDSQGALDLRRDDLVGLMRNSNDLGLVHLRNYPEPGEQYTCLRGLDNVYYGIRSKLVSERPGINWVDIGNDLNQFLDHIRKGHGNVHRALRELSRSLSQQPVLYLVAVDFFDGKTSKWSGKMELQQRADDDVSELRPVGAVIPGVLPARILEHGTLRRVVVQSSDIANLVQLRNLMQSNVRLEQIKIQTLEDEMLPRLAELCEYYKCEPGPLHIVLFEKAKPTEGRDFARLSIQKAKGKKWARVIKVDYWDCDCILGALKRKHVVILDAASTFYPTVLASFTMDVSKLSLRGLALLEGVVQRSTIERLHIRCVKVKEDRKSIVGNVLAAVQWATLKSLVLSGDNIDAWIRLWDDHGKLSENTAKWIRQWPYGPRLMRLELQGTAVTENRLEHKSLLALHRLVYCCRLVQLKLDNILPLEMQDETLLKLLKQSVGGTQAQAQAHVQVDK
ncbi:hypothetical protein BGZ93_011432 [Podila epicladia]|nr:hypothetical protein BGZ93_011432 [Podila epicladia]